MALEVRFLGLNVRVSKGQNTLTALEKQSINTVIKPLLGYDDVDALARDHGFDTANDLAAYHSYANPRDFFLADGYVARLTRFKKNGSTD